MRYRAVTRRLEVSTEENYFKSVDKKYGVYSRVHRDLRCPACGSLLLAVFCHGGCCAIPNDDDTGAVLGPPPKPADGQSATFIAPTLIGAISQLSDADWKYALALENAREWLLTERHLVCCQTEKQSRRSAHPSRIFVRLAVALFGEYTPSLHLIRF
jgi:hypothetical protein